jgi:hypothetical protein
MPDKCPRKPAKAAPARNDQQTAPESPVDMDSFRRDLSRRLSRIVGNRAKRWRTCGEP